MENMTKPKKRISQRIAEFLFTIYLITLYIFVNRGETIIISQIAFVLFAIFTVIAVLRSKSIHIGRNVMIVYVTFTWMFATVFWANHTYEASVMMKTMWQLFILFFLTYNLFVKEADAHEYLMKSLYIAGIILIGYSIYVYGFTDVINMMTTQSSTRLGTEINQANTFGMMNATTVMVAFYYFLYKKGFKLFHAGMIGVAFLFAMSSGSKKALLMICIGLLFLVFKKYSFKQIYKVVIVGAILVFVFMAIIKLPMFDFINGRMEKMFEFVTGAGKGDNSSRVRFDMIMDGWEAFKSRVFTGYGANNYRFVASRRTYAHNNFIEILVNFGLFGFVLYYLIYFTAFKNLWMAKQDASKALVSIFVVRTMMEIAMVTYYDKIHWIMMAFFLISITGVKPEGKKGNKKQRLMETQSDEEVLTSIRPVAETGDKN